MYKAVPEIFTQEWLKVEEGDLRREFLVEKLGGVRPAVLLLDDDPDYLVVLESMFQQLGIEVFATTSPAKASECVRQHRSRILLIFCDLKMPEMSGFEWRKIMAPMAAEIPFVILSGYVDREMALQGLELKITAFLEKPLEEAALLELLYKEADLRARQIRDDYDLLKSFLEDAETILERIEQNFLELESRPNEIELLNETYGLFHTMKGNSGFFEPRTFHDFIHRFEDQIKLVQKGEAELDVDRLAAWYRGLNVVKELIREFQESSHKEHDLAQLLSVFSASPAGAQKQGDSAESLEAAGDAAAKTKVVQVKDIKVSMKLLDEFMQTSGEMTVIRNMINKAAQSLEKRYSSDRDVQLLSELLSEMHKINSDVQNKINALRRVSLQTMLRPLTRTLRDTARALDKKVDLKIEGQDLRVDNSIAEVFSHSLIHLVRNSLDHGLETPSERIKAGKPEMGALKIQFRESADKVEARISDDGRGINIEKMRQKVLEQGLKTQIQIDEMSHSELFSMIFEAGFSTAQATTQFSGRGVGMSMVKDVVQSAGGSIQIESKQGQGSEFVLSIPIPKSALIEACLFVKLNERVFALPQNKILKVVRPADLAESQICHLNGATFMRFAERLLPVLDFAEVVALEQKSASEKDIFIVLSGENSDYVLQVSEVFDVEDTVVKTLQFEGLRGLGIYKGGTFLSDGSVGLVLDVDGIAQRMALRSRSLNASGAAHISALTSEASVRLERFITFSLGGEGLYCLGERDLVRIEELSHASFELSAGWWLVPYREGVLPVIDTAHFLASGTLRSLEDKNIPSSLCVLVVECKGRLLALSIDKLVDLEESVFDVHESTNKESLYRGHLQINGRSIALLDLEKISEALEAKKTDWQSPLVKAGSEDPLQSERLRLAA